MEIELKQADAKLAFLAVAYHLGRPGSELDPISKSPVDHGLAEVSRDLQPQLRLAVARLDLNDSQVTLLQSGMLGSITELKTYPLLQPRLEEDGSARRSSVPGFDRSLVHLFPEVEEDADLAVEVAEQMLLLKRRLDSRLPSTATAKQQEAKAPEKRRWWPFHR